MWVKGATGDFLCSAYVNGCGNCVSQQQVFAIWSKVQIKGRSNVILLYRDLGMDKKSDMFMYDIITYPCPQMQRRFCHTAALILDMDE